MTQRMIIFVLTILSSLCMPATIFASGSQGTESPFAFGAGAREIALGTAPIARPSPAIAPFWNPAYLAEAEHLSLLVFHSQLYESDILYQYAGIAYPTLDLGTIGIGIFRLGVDGIERRDANNLLLGETSESRMAYYFAYGKTVSGFNLGAAIHFEQHSLADLEATSSPALNLSISRTLRSGIPWMPSVSAVLSGRNIIGEKTRLESESLEQPVGAEVGFTAQLMPSVDENHLFELSVRTVKLDMVDPVVCAGIEYALYNTLYLRGGVRDNDYSWGTGLRVKNFQFDYSMTGRDLGNLHLINLATYIGASRSDRLALRKEREATRFNELMRKSLSSQSEAVADSLVDKGRQLLASGSFEQASTIFDRALFLYRSSGGDTTVIAELAAKSSAMAAKHVEEQKFTALIDSTLLRIAEGDLITANYFLTIAESINSEADDVKRLRTRIDAELNEMESTQQLVRDRIAQADSLLTYGQPAAALEILQPLNEIASADDAVSRMLTRARFEIWKGKAQYALNQQNRQLARAALDSAQTYLPNHPWCGEFVKRLAQTETSAQPAQTQNRVLTPVEVSPALREEVGKEFADGKRLFEQGNLEAAVVKWEKVERLVPNFEDVRSYLVRAYKFVGVKLYGQDQLVEAVAAWKRATELAPDDSELREYINRTEKELMNLRELTYEER